MDASNNVYVIGSVGSADLAATPGVFQPVLTGGMCMINSYASAPCLHVFIAKFSSTGTLLFLSYLGGTGADIPYAIAVDASGNIFVGGTTTSADFPLAGSPWRPTLGHFTTFLAKISGDGSKLIWSTVINGGPVQLALTPSGDLDVLTESVSFPPSPTLTQLTSAGQFVTSASVPGGTDSLAIGTDGSVYIAGTTAGGGVAGVTATPGAWQTTYGGGINDGFVAKMSPDLSGFAWLTFVGGDGNDLLHLAAIAPDGSLWVGGGTDSSNFPVTAGALEPSAEGDNGFLVHLSADGSKALASTYTPFFLDVLATDSSADAVFSGSLGQFPATPGSEWPCRVNDATSFLGKIDSAGQQVLWGTWTGPVVPAGVAAADTHGNVIVAGNVPGQTQLTLSALSTSNTPRLVESCIAPSANGGAPGPLAPGELFSIYGAGFGPAQGVVAQSSGGMIGTSLGGIQVTVEGTPVPLLYVSAGQINAVAPFLLEGHTAAHVKIVTVSGTSNEVVLGVRDELPEIFAISNQDGTVNSQAHPAHGGDFMSIWASGLGQTNPPSVDGAIPAAAGGTPLAPVTLQIQPPYSPGGFIKVPPSPENASVLYAGYAPGFVSGVAQINFELPDLPAPLSAIPLSGPPYTATVTMTVGGAAISAYIWFE